MSDDSLAGLRVIVARPRDQAAELVELLENRGAEAVSVPVIEIVDPEDGGAELRAGLAELTEGDWVVATSPNGVARVHTELGGRPMPGGVSFAVIGPGTRQRAVDLDLDVDLVARTSIAEGLLEALPDPGGDGETMLLARAASARAVLPDGLRARGWRVNDIAAYRTVGVPVSDADTTRCRHGDIAAFTSASTVRHLLAGVGPANLPPVVACIGPATAREARELGLAVDISARDHTLTGLVEAMVAAVPGTVFVRPEPAAAQESQWMLEQYFEEIDRRFESGLDRGSVLTTEPDEISPPDGLFVAARVDGRPVGCGALKLAEPGVADIKRMWVSDAVRGRGLGRRLLRRLVAEGAAMGLNRVRLETNQALTEAIGLYRSEGFVEVPAFNDEPHADHWFVLDLM